MKRICTICARGGSKGVKNKNIRELLGRPLLAYSILQAREAKLFDVVAVSSDSKEILQVAEQWGADIMVQRPLNLATDTAAKVPAIQHCVKEAERDRKTIYNTVVDLDVTSPLRLAADICAAVELLESKKVSNVITGMPARRSPYFNLVEIDATGVVRLSKKLDKPIVRRQDSPKCYDMNASIYVWQREALFENASVFNDDTLLYVMPEERSIDIDSEQDFAFVDFLFSRRKSRI